MENSKSISSTVLPIAYSVLRVLLVVNWIYGVGILALLIVSVVNEPWFIAAMNLPAAAERVVPGFRAIMVLGLVAVPLNRTVLTRLIGIVETVRSRDPFVDANAKRLQTIGWMLLILNVLSILIGAISTAVSSETHPVHLDAGFSISGWLVVLLTFVLARVFAEGALMREDLEGTI